MDQSLARCCPVCSRPIPARTHGGGTPKMFCSEKCRKKQAEARRYQKHRQRLIKLQAEWVKANPHRRAVHCRGITAAMPAWLSAEQMEEMRLVYEKARRLTRETGIRHEVDHIHPIRGDSLCGLHVPWNLRVVTITENKRKWRKLIPDDALAG